MNPLSSSPKISIVMPAYNASKYIIKAVESILNQTYRTIEVLIADDKSTDNTREIIDNIKDSRIKILHNEQNLGYLKTCNKLLSNANGELITFQDADDFSPSDRLEIQLSAFLNDIELGACTTNYTMVNEKGKKIISRNWNTNYLKFKSDINYNPLFCGATIMVKREVMDDVGLYNTFFDRIGGEDYEWLYRIASKYKVIHLQQDLYSYRIHDSAVKTTNTNRKKYYVHEILNFIRTQHILTGKDYLSEKYLPELNKKIDELDKPFREDNSMISRIEAYTAFNNGTYWRFLFFLAKAIISEPGKIDNYKILPACIYSQIRKLFKKSI